MLFLSREKPPNYLDGFLLIFTFWFDSKFEWFFVG